MAKPTNVPAEQRPEKIREVRDLMKTEKIPTSEACKRSKISVSQFYGWQARKKASTKKKSKMGLVTLPDLSATSSGRITITQITCSVADLQSTLSALNPQ